jgi:hypothetical protein
MYNKTISAPPFCADIFVSGSERGQLVAERVASHDQIYILQETPESTDCKLQYRKFILEQLRGTSMGSDNVDKLVEKFVRLAQNLESTKAIALPFQDRDNILATKWPHKAQEIHYPKRVLLNPTELLFCEQIEASLLHPLVIALLAYQMGGAVNAANTLYSRQWQSSKAPEPELARFYSEGDTKSIADDHRVTLVWEERGGRSTAVSGDHHIFTENQAKPQPLTPLSWMGEDSTTSPMIIVYDYRSTELWYEYQDAEKIRISFGLDFHVNTITDADLHLLNSASQDGRDLGELTLTQLITEFPLPDYTFHFARLLFDTGPREMMLSALESLEVSHQDPSPQPESSRGHIYQRFQQWDADNLANIPDFLRELPFGYPVSGVYETPADFIDCLSYRMQQDIHFFIGMDLMPQTVADNQRETARKVIRDQTGKKICQKLAAYVQSLTMDCYGCGSLLSTAQLQAIAEKIEITYLDLTSRGYADGSFILVSFSSLSSKLGRALNSTKEIDITPEARVMDQDLQIFRTRCLYLFWCADFLVRYLSKLREGPCMINRLTPEEMSYIWPETMHMAEQLLRNWVAWGLFVETLPTGGFTVGVTPKA